MFEHYSRLERYHLWLSQLKEYRFAIRALQETRWQGKDIMGINL
jgi:hypothetical protein